MNAMFCLLKHGVNVKADDSKRNMPLHIAALVETDGSSVDAARAVDLLVRWGADETTTNDDDDTAADITETSFGNFRPAKPKLSSVQLLLARAPADRAWRHRGLLMLTVLIQTGCG